jgi:type VI secretion system protein ImpG
MNKRLLEYYEQELRFLREQGREFAESHPAVAERLGIDDEEIADPYVRHLTQAFAFLAARVSMRFDDEFPTLSQGLLSVIDPMIQRPIPSVAIIQMQARQNGPEKRTVIKRGEEFRSEFASGRAPCRFRTTQDVTLLPVRVSEAHYLGRDLPSLGLSTGAKARAAITLTIEATKHAAISKTPVDALDLFIHGGENTPGSILEQLHTDVVEVVVRSLDDGAQPQVVGRLEPDSIRECGLDQEQALLPIETRSFDGERLLTEYFISPRRCFFVTFSGLDAAMKACAGKRMQIVVLLKRRMETLESVVTADNFRLFCTPVVNLFDRLADRIDLLSGRFEHQIIPDRTQPLDFEVYSVHSVNGFGADSTPIPFRPFYASTDDLPDAHSFYMTRRMRPVFENSRRSEIGRSHYTNSQVYLNIVDVNRAPYAPDLKQLEVRTLCTSGVGAAELASGPGEKVFKYGGEGPVESARSLVGPTSPRESRIEHADAWRLIDRLSLNYLRITGGRAGANALRSALALHADADNAVVKRQLEALALIDAAPATRPIVGGGRLAWCRGLKIDLTLDEDGFTGTGVYALGAILNRYFAGFSSLNSFTETTLCTTTRGPIKTWPPRSGARRIL